VTDGKRVVGDKPFGENPLVAFTGFLGLGEVIGKIGADELVARNAGDFNGAFVNVRDFSFRADGDQRI
jgi:hypothetical protein